MSTEESAEVVAMLVTPNEYVYHLGEAAGLTMQDLIIIERKLVSRAGFELVKRPLQQVRSVEYFDERPLTRIIAGVFLSALILFIAGMVIYNWNDLEAGTKIPILSLATAGAYGVKLMLGARRHRFVFTMDDDKKHSWSSRPGEFDLWKPSTENIRQFAKARGLLLSRIG